jgi:parallel beta-helix repeat protein
MTKPAKLLAAAIVVAALATLALITNPATSPPGASGADTVHVAPPTGERTADRASILAALEAVQPGGTVQFAPGTYLMGGAIIRITIPRITLLGHPDGTTLLGCHRDEFPMEDPFEFGDLCNGLELAAGWQTIRNLHFEHAFWALHVGCCWATTPEMLGGDGGHVIEGNTFSNSSNALRVHGFWTEPTVIRNNRFVNNWHSVAVYGNTVHLLDNDIEAPEPERVQWFGFPAEAIHVVRPMELHESAMGVTRACANNIVAGNRIDGITEGIMMTADDAETPCRNNVIRDNVIVIRRAHPASVPDFLRAHDDDATVIGVPLALRGVLIDNVIEGNEIRGAEGLGIEIRGGSRNRIVNNTVSGVIRREPFPGNSFASIPVLGGDPAAWREANGAAIWISPGSSENEIAGNRFVDLVACAVYLEGDGNIVETRDAGDVVCDSGTGNRLRGAGAPPDG